MGGPGSGRLPTFNTKTTVEQCLVLAADRSLLGQFPEEGAVRYSLTWRHGNREEGSIGCCAMTRDGERRLALRYRTTPRQGESEQIEEPIELTWTPCRFGGRRWWFRCPLIRNGQLCGRRVAKLYLPPGGRYFGCRHCYDLTYTSAQEAHKYDRLFAHVAGELGTDWTPAMVKRALEGRAKWRAGR